MIFNVFQSSDEESTFRVFDHRPMKTLHLSDLDLSDSDDNSSGISSNDMNIDDYRLSKDVIIKIYYIMLLLNMFTTCYMFTHRNILLCLSQPNDYLNKI